MIPAHWIDNWLAWTLQITVVAGVGILLPTLLPLRLPHVALRYWQGLLLVLLLLPAVQPWRPTQSSVVRVAVSETRAVASESEAVSRRLVDWSMAQIVGWVVLAGVAWRLGRMGAGLCRLRTYRRRARQFCPLPPVIEEMQKCVGVPAAVCLSTGIDVPVTFGVNPAVILLPADFAGLDPSVQSAIACHELLHVKRRDWIWALGEELFGALFWFHPLVHWLLARIQLAREQVVDSEVVRITGNRRLYVEALLQAADRARRPNPLPSPLFLKESQLAARVALMLQEVSMSKRRILASVLVMSCLLFAAARVAAWSFPLALPQSGASERFIQGKVHDPSGAVVREATVTIVDGQSGRELARTVSDEFGNFVVERPASQNYRLVIERPGFMTSSYSREFLTGQSSPLFVRLKIGQISESLTVQGVVPTRAAQSPSKKPASQDRPQKDAEQIEPPQVAQRVSIPYPPQAKEAGVQGEVVSQVIIDEDGNVLDVEIASGHELFRDAATEALRQWKFFPARLQGKPVRAQATVTVRFSLSADEAKAASTESIQPLRVGGAVQASKLIHSVPPVYPEQAKQAGVAGPVILQVTVNERGEVSGVKLLKGNDLLNDAAIEAVRQWRYAPTLLNGQPIAVIATVTISFSLEP